MEEGCQSAFQVEVEAVASRDESEEAREQLLSLVDAALFSGELVLSTVVGRTKSTVLPKLVSDEVLDDVLPQTWSILKSFRLGGGPIVDKSGREMADALIHNCTLEAFIL